MISTAPQFSPNTPYIGFFDAKINTNNNNQIMMIASIDDPAIATTVDRAVVLAAVDGSGALQSETVIAKEGDLLPGQLEVVADFSTGPHESAVNDNGDVLYLADLAGDTGKDGALYLNTTLLAQEGGTSPVPGRFYEFLLARGVDLSNNGSWVVKANLDGTVNDDVLIVNNAVFKREGDTFAAISPYVLTGFGTASGPVYVDDYGNVLWYGTWSNPNTEEDSGLFLNDCLIVQEGVSSVGGLLIDTIANGADAFAMSDNGQWVIFEAVLSNALEGAFLAEIAEPIPVVLSQFAAVPVNGAIEIAWATSAEFEHVGFVLLRSTNRDEGFEPVREEMFLPGAYHFRDTTGEPGTRYWYLLEAVGRAGERQRFGPVTADFPFSAARLGASRPNPLPRGGVATIDFLLPRASTARLKLYDVGGRLVATLLEAPLNAGHHEATWDGFDASGHPAPAGVYFYVLETPDAVMKQRLLLLP